MRRYNAEILCAAIIAVIYAANIVIAYASDQRIAWHAWQAMYIFGTVIGLLGILYRLSKRSEALALSLIATAIMIFFTHAAGIFNHLLFPLDRPLIDPLLFDWDARLGYDWPAFVERIALWPALGRALGHVYDSSLLQLALVILVLGYSERAVQLHRFVLVGVLGGCVTILVWWVAPSFGPAAYLDVTEEATSSIRLRVDAVYGAELNRMAVEGVPVIRPEAILGVIAFPSFHTHMACMTVWFSRSTRIFWPMLLLNTAMIPAILSHGGHHLVDLFGGVALFVAVLWITTLIVPTPAPVRDEKLLSSPLPVGLRGG